MAQQNNQRPMTGFEKLLFWGTVFYGVKKLVTYQSSDTINYRLWYRGRIVYVGICYEDRIEKRLIEHKCKGLRFDDYDHDDVKPRSAALEKERRQIRRHRPKYNIHHNYNS